MCLLLLLALHVGHLERALLFYLNLVVNCVVEDCTQCLLILKDQTAPAVGQSAYIPRLVGGLPWD